MGRFQSETVSIWQRLMLLADRDPRRAIMFVRRVAAQTTPEQAPWAAYTLGWALFRWERLEEATAALSEASALFQQQDAAIPLLHCRRALLLVAQSRGVNEVQQSDWEALAADYAAAGLPEEVARSRIQQASHLNMLGYPTEALALLDSIRAQVEATGSLDDRARMLRVGAVVSINNGQIDRAQREMDRVDQLIAQLHSPLETAKSLLNRAWLEQRHEDRSRSLEAIRRALRIFQHLEMPNQIATCERDYGVQLMHDGRYGDALASVLRAREHFQQVGWQVRIADSELTIGNIAYYSALYPIALAAYRRAEQIYQQLQIPRLQLASQRNQAMVLHDEGKLTEALALLQSLVEPLRQIDDQMELAEVAHALAKTLHRLGRVPEALEHSRLAQQQFLSLGNASAAAECQSEQGWMSLELGDPVAAEAVFQTAARALVERPVHAWQSNYGIGACRLAQQDRHGALQYFLAASRLIADLRQSLMHELASSGLFVQAQELYEQAVRLAADLDDLPAFLQLTEGQRALAFNRQALAAGFHMSAALQEEERQLRARLLALQQGPNDPAALDEVAQAFTDLLLRTRHSTPRAADRTPPLDLVRLRQQLDAAYPEGWTVLSIIQTSDELLVLQLDRQGEQLQRVPLLPDLRGALARVTQASMRKLVLLDLARLRNPSRRPWDDLALIAERLLSAALRAELCPEHRLLIVPDGMLHGLPWAALRLESAWLCEAAIVQILPSLGSWPQLAARPVPSEQALLFGCQSFGERAAALPAVPHELETLAQIWPGQREVLLDTQVERGRLMALADAGTLYPYRLIYVATHAQLLPAHGLLAHIKLNDDDLLLDDVQRLRLGGASVLLATCDGAAGDVLPGAEVLSLSRAFLVAGARDVIAGLWPLDDGSATPMFAEIVRALGNGLDAGLALATAQRTVLHSGSSPLVWGGFTMVGAGT